MKDITKSYLKKFLEGIPVNQREFHVNFSHVTDEIRLIEVAISLLDNDDTIDIENIRQICEEIGGDEYLGMIKNKDLFDYDFAHVIYSRIDDVKNIISLYRKIIKTSS